MTRFRFLRAVRGSSRWVPCVVVTLVVLVLTHAAARDGGRTTLAAPLRAAARGWWRRVIDVAHQYTMIGAERLATSLLSAAHVTATGVAGDFVETGVARGGSAGALMLAAVALGVPRVTHLYDTFAGMPAANASVDGTHALEFTGTINHGVAEVAANLAAMGADVSAARFHRGDITAAPLAELPTRIALLRIDTDWYASYVWAFEHLLPRVAPGGIVLLDDYYDWPGAKLATSEFLARPGNEHVRLDATQNTPMLCTPLASGEAAPCGRRVLRSIVVAAGLWEEEKDTSPRLASITTRDRSSPR